MSKSQYFSGRVQSVVFANEGNAFYIVRMILDREDDEFLLDRANRPVTVTGTIPGIKVGNGTWFGFEAKWTTHDTYGRQLDITRAPVLKDGWNPEIVCNMLVANGVGFMVMETIKAHFGNDLMKALEDPERLEEAPGIAKFSALYVSTRWTAVRAQFQALDFLSGLGLPGGLVRDIWVHFGDDAEKMLVTNPWALVEVDGITFKNADEVASKMGLVDVDKQIRGAVLYACKHGRGFGHLYLTTGAIFHAVRSMVYGTEIKPIAQALAALHKEELIIIDKKTRPGVTAIYEPWAYYMEQEAADLLVTRLMEAPLLPGEEATDKYIKNLGSVGPLTEKAAKAGREKGRLERVVRVAIDEWGSQAKLVLSDPQKEGIFNALTAPVSVLAGLPGTGKTTSLRAAVRILQDAGVPFLLCAPTGIAAKNLSALPPQAPSTVRSPLRDSPTIGGSGPTLASRASRSGQSSVGLIHLGGVTVRTSHTPPTLSSSTRLRWWISICCSVCWTARSLNLDWCSWVTQSNSLVLVLATCFGISFVQWCSHRSSWSRFSGRPIRAVLFLLPTLW